MSVLTVEERQALLRRRIWTSADFAAFVGLSHWQAKQRLKVYDREMSGMLLCKSSGINRKYTFFASKLAKAFPALFETLEGLGIQVAEHEEKIDELYQRQRAIAAQIGQNSRDLARMRRGAKAA